MPSAITKLQPCLNKTTLISLSIGLLVLIVSYPLALVLPSWVSWENGPVENAQVVVLLLGMVQALIFQKYGSADWKWLWRGAALIWFICAMRECCWCRFMEPLGMSEKARFSPPVSFGINRRLVPALIGSILLLAVLC